MPIRFGELGTVYRYEGGTDWTNCGKVADVRSISGLAVFNGKLYAGTLPFADVYRYEGDDKWVSTGRLDNTPDVRYRRAWSMAVYDGKLYISYKVYQSCQRRL